LKRCGRRGIEGADARPALKAKLDPQNNHEPHEPVLWRPWSDLFFLLLCSKYIENSGKIGDTKAKVREVRGIPVWFSGYNHGNQSTIRPVRVVRGYMENCCFGTSLGIGVVFFVFHLLIFEI
jgi:hypothetical protein